MPLNQIASLSRSAGSPALPTAITTRPQLASSPAIAVFTSGEFAIGIAILRARGGDRARSMSAIPPTAAQKRTSREVREGPRSGLPPIWARRPSRLGEDYWRVTNAKTDAMIGLSLAW